MEAGVPKGLIYDIQGFSVHDGPGIRTTVFLKGCPLSCPWCHSPESQSFRQELSFMDMKCIGTEKCGLCLKQCPNGAVSPGRAEWSEIKQEHIRHIALDFDRCVRCEGYPCAKRCFPGALSVAGTYYTVDEIVERVKKDLPFYEKSGSGGVTVSGGEPLAQFPFTLALLRRLKAEGINTALDTTGFAPTERILEAAPYVDTFLYDLKHMDSAEHRRVTGVPNELILANTAALARAGAHFQIRMPVIPGFNDSDENFGAFSDFCLSLGAAVDTVQLLPYHRFGEVKYERLNRKCPMPDSVAPPDEGEIKRRVRQLCSLGLHAVIH